MPRGTLQYTSALAHDADGGIYAFKGIVDLFGLVWALVNYCVLKAEVARGRSLTEKERSDLDAFAEIKVGLHEAFATWRSQR